MFESIHWPVVLLLVLVLVLAVQVYVTNHAHSTLKINHVESPRALVEKVVRETDNLLFNVVSIKHDRPDFRKHPLLDSLADTCLEIHRAAALELQRSAVREHVLLDLQHRLKIGQSQYDNFVSGLL